MLKLLKKVILSLLVFYVGIIFVNAKTLNVDTDINTSSYIIGTHVFTSKVTLDIKKIMLAAKTINSDNISDMVIYYKEPWGGNWVDAVTGKQVDIGSTKTITHIDLQRIDGLKIMYHSNGGTGEMSDQIIPVGDTGHLTANSFEKNNYVFKFWSTQADGIGDTYYDLSYLTSENSSDTINLYAQWEPLESVITFNDLSNINVNYDKIKVFVIKASNGTVAWFIIEDGKVRVYQKTGVEEETADYEYVYNKSTNKWSKNLIDDKNKIHLEDTNVLCFKNYRVLNEEESLSELSYYGVIRQEEVDSYDILTGSEINNIITISYE